MQQDIGIRFHPHPVLGFMASPNLDQTIEGITVCGSTIRYHVTSDAEGRRPTDAVAKSGADRVFVFGCSYSYGWCLSDHETYAWLLQQALPETQVTNFAQPGYGTTHALLQLAEELRQGRIPRVCVVAYLPTMASPHGHPDRNVANPLNILAIANQSEFSEHMARMSFPRAHVQPNGQLSVSYIPMDLRGLRHVKPEAVAVDPFYTHVVTGAIVDVILNLAKQHGFAVVFAKMLPDDRDPIARHLRERHGIEMIDCVLPLEADASYRVARGDTHPSALSHAIYCDRLLPSVRRALLAKAA